jgi:hypothetical protein
VRIVTSSDWHGDWTTLGVDRFPDVERQVERIVEYAVKNADVFVFCGDLTDPDTPGAHRAIGLACRAASRLAQEGVVSVWIPGNHDVVEDGTGTTTLAALAGIEVGGAVRKRVRVFERPAASLIKLDDGDRLAVVALPYPSRATNYDPAAFVESLADPPEGVPCLVIGHLAIGGDFPKGSESGDMARGREVCWPSFAQLREKFPKAIVLAGHYHRPSDGYPIVIGALESLTMGEVIEPRFLCIEYVLRNPGSGDEPGWVIGSCPLEARKVVTLEPNDPIWTGEPEGSFAWAQGAIVRAFPPTEGAEPHPDVAARLAGAGALRCVVMPAARGEAEVLDPSLRSDPAETVRGIVGEMVEAANVLDREALRSAVEECLVSEGL